MTQINNGDKLYIITRKDLSPGYQAVQAVHSAIQFAFENPDKTKNWYYNSNYIGLLSVDKESDLISIVEKAKEQDIAFSIFREPDLDNEITAVALEAGSKTKKLCSRFPLALK